MDSEWELLDLVLSVNLGLLVPLLPELGLLLMVVIVAVDDVEIVRLPVFEGCFGLVDLVVSNHLIIMVFQVLV